MGIGKPFFFSSVNICSRQSMRRQRRCAINLYAYQNIARLFYSRQRHVKILKFLHAMLLLVNMIGRESTGKECGLKRLDHNRTDYEIG